MALHTNIASIQVGLENVDPSGFVNYRNMALRLTLVNFILYGSL